MDFRLFPRGRHWWSLTDYGAVLDVMHRLEPSRVLEFGPGWSTLALVEGGAERIDACENETRWVPVLTHRFVDHPQVHLHLYAWTDPIAIPAIDASSYDLALIDGPADVTKRFAVIRYAVARCAAVLVPTEDAEKPSGLPEYLAAVAQEARRRVEFWRTGPYAGGFGLVTT